MLINKPRFTIITATFNASILFERTAKSIINQSYRNFEWLVIDGMSNDDTIEYLKKYSNFISYWKSEPDKGISDAWNKGIEYSKGEYILILNAGDTYDHNFLEIVNNYADIYSNKILCAHTRLMTNSGTYIKNYRSRPKNLYRGMHIAHNWSAVPRAMYELQGVYKNLKIAMDFEWFHRYYILYGENGFQVIDSVQGHYFLGGVSDINYKNSFLMNARICIQNGASPLISYFWAATYIISHSIKRYLTKKKFL
jgi:glycosyltransferase involved in cell wall biosynthesis